MLHQEAVGMFNPHIFVLGQIIFLKGHYMGLALLCAFLIHQRPSAIAVLFIKRFKLSVLLLCLLLLGLEEKHELRLSLLIELVITLADWASLGHRHDQFAWKVQPLLHMFED